jgi:tetratricopeptide (TPR) repeat protein
MRRAPRHFLTHYARGALLGSKGDLDGAIAAIEYVLAMNPHLAEAHARLGRAKIGAGLAHEAVAHIEEAIRLGPASRNRHSWYLWAGQAAIHVGEYGAAFQWLQKARQANPGSVQVLPWLAMAYAGLGREDEGRALIHEYLQSGPRLTISQWTRARALKSGVLAEQRSRIVAMLKQLGVPEDGAQTVQ